MIRELHDIIQKIKYLNTAHGYELVTQDEINKALKDVDEFKEDLDDLRSALQEIEKSDLGADDLTILTIAKLNRYFGDMIQDLQNIAELIDLAAKNYYESTKSKNKELQ